LRRSSRPFVRLHNTVTIPCPARQNQIIAYNRISAAAIQHRLADSRKGASEREKALKDIEHAQEEARATLDSDRRALEKELNAVKVERDRKAQSVPRPLLQRYDRIRSRRRTTALFPLRGQSCAHCDTAIPVQRRSTMAATGATELCEGCGVLLYAAE